MIDAIKMRVVLLVLLAPLYVVAQVDQQQSAKNEAGGTSNNGMITGRVVDERGQPIANATVSVRAVGFRGQAPLVTTDRDGAFQASGLERASYIVSASMPAYTVAPRDPSINPATTYRVGDSVTLTLIKGGVVTGTVTNANGDPVIAISVRAQMIRDANGRRVQNNFAIERPTDDRGVYRIYGIPTGTYVVLAGGTNNYSYIPINAYELDVPTYAPSSTRESAAEISVRAGEETAGIDIRYRGETGRVISGQVNGGPDNATISVTLTAAGEAVAPWSLTTYQAPGLHAFSFSGVGDGDYNLIAMSYAPGIGGVVSTPKRITVRGADVTGIELIAKPFASVSGRVLLEESKAPECADKRRPLFNETLVSAWHNDNDAAKQVPAFVWSYGTPVPPDADGSFKLKNVAPGQYYFVTRFSAKYWYLQSITFTPASVAGAKTTAKPTDATRIWTNIKPGDNLSGLTITLAQGAASLRGQLGLGEGEQVPERLFVYLAPVEREMADDLLRFYAAPVGADGKIALNNVAPGRYWILPQVYGDDASTPLSKLRLPDATETRAKLRREAEAAKTEIEFKPCQNVVNYQLPLRPKEQ